MMYIHHRCVLIQLFSFKWHTKKNQCSIFLVLSVPTCEMYQRDVIHAHMRHQHCTIVSFYRRQWLYIMLSSLFTFHFLPFHLDLFLYDFMWFWWNFFILYILLYNLKNFCGNNRGKKEKIIGQLWYVQGYGESI